MATGSTSFNFGANKRPKAGKKAEAAGKKKSSGKGRSDAWRSYTGGR
ncbi:MAG TPA: hypothetical protein VMS17_17770 [Gemmataceae bacterium]|nr:hypothetical protein [Gemmataceae bacterium]